MGKISYNKLFALLNNKNLTQQYLVNNGINKHTISRLKRCDNISTDTITKICDILNCTPNDIMSYDGADQTYTIDCNYAPNCDVCDISHICRARIGDKCDYYDDCPTCNLNEVCRGNQMHRTPGTKRPDKYKGRSKEESKMIMIDEDFIRLYMGRGL